MVEFAEKGGVYEYLRRKVDDPCVDNFRFARADSPDEMKLYASKKKKGCCGSHDEKVVIAGVVYWVGCNYGH